MPLQPEQALYLRDNAIRSMKAEQPITRRVIEAIPLDKGDYRPDDVGKSALELAWHIAGAEHRFSEALKKLRGRGRLAPRCLERFSLPSRCC